ncbi:MULTISPECIES: aminotransferase class I/II-fold pyridoxal phosphate-dependent enzyme [Clostridia]|uniref:aminotransferase class I/II-fold pyridoxal phosphate-dependent enzyme n=1 Tax=Clostridia TaxID=186801 RepID=UPI001FAB1C38|nr:MULTISPECIES: aminotransferase class I/II-fold pyridoxal phosphate-dependent enzyme [Clostridia]
MAPTKAFNLAGIQTAAVIVPDVSLRHKVSRGLNTDEVAEPNVFAAIAPVAAFSRGGGWLDDLRAYLWENRRFAENYIKKEIKSISAVSARATYLLWLDCRRIIGNSSDLCHFIRKHSGLYLSDGNEYRNGEGFLRMNLACPRQQVEDGLNRLKESVEAYEAWVSKQC